jgi:hypothetical protein
MRFDTIHDPSDPAWYGHAVTPAWWERSEVRAVGAALVVVVALATALVVRGGDPVPRATAATTPTPRVVEVAVPTTVPALDTASSQPVRAPAAKHPASPAHSYAWSWAPAAATSSSTSKLLTGDLAGIHPELKARLDGLAQRLGRKVEVVSGWRTHEQQRVLYRRFQSGTGNLAAVPGRSMHEQGLAADVYVDGVALANVPGVANIAPTLGLHFPVAGEAWHVEMVETTSVVAS